MVDLGLKDIFVEDDICATFHVTKGHGRSFSYGCMCKAGQRVHHPPPNRLQVMKQEEQFDQSSIINNNH